jgi:hypothetical protein
MQTYNPNAWFWFVGGDTTKVFSSATGTYILASDPAYSVFAETNRATNIVSEAELIDVLAAQAPSVVFATPTGLTAYAASKRYDKEIGGTTISGVAYPTDRDTQSKLASAVLFAQLTPAAVFQWKVADGTFVTLTGLEQIVAVASAIGAFVQGCFALEATTVTAIKAGTITTTAQVDAAFA